MHTLLNGWPDWVEALLWTVGGLGAGYLIGQVLRASIGGRLARLARRTEDDWDDALVLEVGRRLPFWMMLIGAYLVLPRWELSVDRHALIVNILRAIGVASATVAAATIAARLVSACGPRVAPSTPVSALTQNVVRGRATSPISTGGRRPFVRSPGRS